MPKAQITTAQELEEIFNTHLQELAKRKKPYNEQGLKNSLNQYFKDHYETKDEDVDVVSKLKELMDSVGDTYKALRDEQKRQAEAEQIQLAAEEEARKKAAEEEAARLKAEQEHLAAEAEQKRLADEQEAARLKAEQEHLTAEAEQKRLADEEEAARLKEEQKRQAEVEQIQLAAEKEAQQKAEQERLAAEEDATRLKAEQEHLEVEATEQKHLADEEARLKEEQKRQTEAEQIQLAAEEVEHKRLADEEQKRLADEAAHLKAEQERQAEAEQIQLAAEEEARKQAAEEEEQKRLEAIEDQITKTKQVLGESNVKVVDGVWQATIDGKVCTLVPNKRGATWVTEDGVRYSYYSLMLRKWDSDSKRWFEVIPEDKKSRSKTRSKVVIITALLLLALFGVSGAAILVFTHGAAAPLLYALGAFIVSNLGFALPLAIASLTIAGLSLMALAAEIQKPGIARDYIINLFTLRTPRKTGDLFANKKHGLLKALAYAAGFTFGLLLYPVLPVAGLLYNTFKTARKGMKKIKPYWLGSKFWFDGYKFSEKWKGKLGNWTYNLVKFLIAWPLSIALFPLTTLYKGASKFGRWLIERSSPKHKPKPIVDDQALDYEAPKSSSWTCLSRTAFGGGQKEKKDAAEQTTELTSKKDSGGCLSWVYSSCASLKSCAKNLCTKKRSYEVI